MNVKINQCIISKHCAYSLSFCTQTAPITMQVTLPRVAASTTPRHKQRQAYCNKTCIHLQNRPNSAELINCAGRGFQKKMPSLVPQCLGCQDFPFTLLFSDAQL